ncbi:hypothetical protein G5I_00167 [Acromyrmex echinatior]|uniref:Uncharacterized protein n=1 Tax=Acromyrmex echinatior TaxID=103372 RepID=F4W462_ACREC|nr:hypothetical protein G5I_00167 [Acromyrmex echinatior]
MCACVIQRRKKANDRGQGRGAVAAGLKKAVERRTYIIFVEQIYEKLNIDLELHLKILRKEKNKVHISEVSYASIANSKGVNLTLVELGLITVNWSLAEVALRIIFLSSIRIQVTILITVFVIILHDAIESRNRAIIHTSKTVTYDLGVCFGSDALRLRQGRRAAPRPCCHSNERRGSRRQVAARAAPHFTPRYTSRRDRVEWEEIPNSIISYKPLLYYTCDVHVILSGLAGSFKPPRRFSALAVAAAGADTTYTGTEGKKIGETRKGANERRGQRAIGDRGKQHRTWYPRVYLRTMRKLNALAEWALVCRIRGHILPSRRVFGINAMNIAALR